MNLNIRIQKLRNDLCTIGTVFHIIQMNNTYSPSPSVATKLGEYGLYSVLKNSYLSLNQKMECINQVLDILEAELLMVTQELYADGYLVGNDSNTYDNNKNMCVGNQR